MERTLVIGGGAIGLSVAYHLAQRQSSEIVLLERNQLTSGTSWHAAGIVGPLRATANMTKLAMYASALFPRLESETGLSTGFRKTGGYWLAREPERLDELHRIAALGSHFGLSVKVESVSQLQHALPYLNLEHHSGGISVAEDAHVNPVDLCTAYAKAAKALGIEIREQSEVVEILHENGCVSGVKLQDGSFMEASKIALCCGAWSKPLAQTAGLALPLQAVEHMYVVTEAMAELPSPVPVIRDLDTGIYLKGDAANKLILGGFEKNAKCWDAFGANGAVPFLELAEDWEQFAPFMDAALSLFPSLASAGIQHFMNGPESFTHDTRPLVGEAPTLDNLYVAAGMNSVGIMSSAGIGRVLADWMVDGAAPMDLWEVDVARVNPKSASTAYMEERMKESVSDQFAMHWPFKQATAGRNLQTSCLHQQWQNCGAVFGSTAGWERGLWYAKNSSERNLPYSIGAQPWRDIAIREAAHMESGTVLLELSPFTKIDISGSDALTFLEQITCSNMDVDIGKITYTLLLNTNGGIETDVTISRYQQNHFRLISGAASRWRDMAYLRRAAVGYTVRINDVTENEAVIGVMGQGSQSLLASLTDTCLNNSGYATSQVLSLQGESIRASKISYVGESGWELSIPTAAAPRVFTALIHAGAKPMGHYALNSCRVEKGFLHWGHDIGPDISPLQAGLDFAIHWQKDFKGMQALLAQKKQGIKKRLCLFDIEDHPLILHDEPIQENDTVVGLTTSGAFGVRTGLTLAFGFIDMSPDESKYDTSQRSFEVQVAGKLYRAKALVEPPFDPCGKRMRS